MSRVTTGDTARAEQMRQAQQLTKQPAVTKKAAAAARGLTIADGVETMPAVRAPQLTPAASQTLRAAVAAGENPFAHLVAQLGTARGAAALPQLAAALGLEADVSLPVELMQAMSEIELAATKLGEGKEGQITKLLRATGKVRQGMMLNLSDAVGAYTGKGSGVPRDVAQYFAENLADKHLNITKELSTNAAKLQSSILAMASAQKAHFPAGMDINAFVQAVLRESYLLQNESLKDFADKVKYYNDLKKKMRAKKAWAMGLGNRDPGSLLEEDLVYFDAEKNKWMYFGIGVEWEGEAPVQDPTASRSSGLTNVDQGLDGAIDYDAEILLLTNAIGPIEDELRDFEQTKTSTSTETIGLPSGESISPNGNKRSLGDLEDRVLDYIERLCEWLENLQPEAKKQAVITELSKGFSVSGSAKIMAPNTLGDPVTLTVDVRGNVNAEDPIGSFRQALTNAWQLWKSPKLAEGPWNRTLDKHVWNFEFQVALPFSSVSWESTKKMPRDLEIKKGMLDELIERRAQLEVDKFRAEKGLDTHPVTESTTTLNTTQPPPPAPPNRDEIEAVAGGYTDWNGTGVPSDPKYSEESIEVFIKTIEENLNTIGDDAQLANVDLQSALQKQQQTLQMMSNISKMLHDTAMSIIRKIGS